MKFKDIAIPLFDGVVQKLCTKINWRMILGREGGDLRFKFAVAASRVSFVWKKKRLFFPIFYSQRGKKEDSFRVLRIETKSKWSVLTRF